MARKLPEPIEAYNMQTSLMTTAVCRGGNGQITSVLVVWTRDLLVDFCDLYLSKDGNNTQAQAVLLRKR